MQLLPKSTLQGRLRHAHSSMTRLARARLAPVLGLVGRRAGQLPDLVDGGVRADGLEVVVATDVVELALVLHALEEAIEEFLEALGPLAAVAAVGLLEGGREAREVALAVPLYLLLEVLEARELAPVEPALAVDDVIERLQELELPLAGAS